MADRALELHFWDNARPMNTMLGSMTFIFDVVLDASILGNSLKKLIESDGWKRLGGGLRVTQSKRRLYLSVPTPFYKGHPSVKVTEEHYKMTMKNHPIASNFPKAESCPSIHPGPETYRSLAVHKDSPKSLNDFVGKPVPMIHLHMVVFEDGTLVSLMWPHMMTDCIGWSFILKSWSSIVAGRGQNVPRFIGYDHDPMAHVGKSSSSATSVLAKRLNTIANLKATGHRLMKSLSFAPPKMEKHLVCLPSDFLQKLYGAAVSAVPHQLYIAEDDVITAWTAQILCKRKSDSTQVAVCKFYDSRPLLPEIFPRIGAYVQNASFPYITTMTAGEAKASPLSRIARAIRMAFSEQARPDQVEPLASLLRKDVKAKNIPLLSRLNAYPIIYLNWNKADLWAAVDFTDAISPSDKSKKSHKDAITPVALARPTYFHTDIIGNHDLSHHEVFAMYGKDPMGNFWMSASLRFETWRCFESEFEKLSSKKDAEV